MRILIKAAVLISASALLSTSASAREWGTAGGWNVIELGESCAITLEYDGKGSSELILMQHRDDNVFITVANDDWSVLDEKQYSIAYSIDGVAYNPPKMSVGTILKYKPGFMTIYDRKFLSAFAAGSSLNVFYDKNPDDPESQYQLIDQLSLTGTAIAVARMDQCLQAVRRDREAELAEKRKFEHLPDDPFGNSEPAVQDTKARDVSHRYSRMFGMQYPAASKAAGLSGSVEAELTIGLRDNVLKCKIVGSSGHELLDKETCEVLNRSGRYISALDESGNAIEGKLIEKVRWEISQPEPAAVPPPAMEIELSPK